MDSFKRVKKKFLTCFRPLSSADDGSIHKKGHRTDRSNSVDDDNNSNKIITYVSVHDQEEKMVLRKFITSISENKKLKDSSDGDAGGCKKDKSRRAFSRAVKAVFFETSLVKKVRRRKHKKVSHASDSDKCATTIEESNLNLNSKNERPVEGGLTSGGSSGSWPSLTHSSSFSSSFSSTTHSTPLFSSASSVQNRSFHNGLGQEDEEGTTFPPHRVGSRCNSNFGLCLVLVCLLVLMTWGRVFAIFCTSACLFMIPSYVYRRRIGVPGQIIRLAPAIDSAEHKKRVIMEGLLQRNRRVL